jgi:hypothetical protein
VHVDPCSSIIPTVTAMTVALALRESDADVFPGSHAMARPYRTGQRLPPMVFAGCIGRHNG